jgi:glycosyltransferase involved in cell wall biosynthesis
MKIVHIINCLDTGGAETMLLRVLSRIDRTRFEPEVISLTNLGEIAGKLNEYEIPVWALDLRRDSMIFNPFLILRLSGWLRQCGPELVQTWMYHSNLIGGLAAKLAGRKPLIWGIRQTNVDSASVRLRTSLIAKGAARLSRTLPDHILYNSHTSRRAHAALGYADDRASVIANGFDLAEYKPDPAARDAVRQDLGLDADALLIGLIARYDPQKDHTMFVAAAGLLHQRHPAAHFLLAGLGVDNGNAPLLAAIADAGISDRCHLLGHRGDTPYLMAALDVACSSSMGEGFPNTVGEAMACGVPCVVTDVGDSALLVGNAGRVVPPGQPHGMAREIASILSMSNDTRRSLGQSARDRIDTDFSLHAIAMAYQKLWCAIAAMPTSSSETNRAP